MHKNVISRELYTGPGPISIDITHSAIEKPLFRSVDISYVISSLKDAPFFRVGNQKEPDWYGPYRKEKISALHFKEIASEQLLHELSNFLKLVNKENGNWITDIDFFIDKVELNTRYIPFDVTRFYYFTPSFSSRPLKGIEDITDEFIIGFDYFLSIVGYNQTNVYLFSIWYD